MPCIVINHYKTKLSNNTARETVRLCTVSLANYAFVRNVTIAHELTVDDKRMNSKRKSFPRLYIIAGASILSLQIKSDYS